MSFARTGSFSPPPTHRPAADEAVVENALEGRELLPVEPDACRPPPLDDARQAHSRGPAFAPQFLGFGDQRPDEPVRLVERRRFEGPPVL